MKIFFWILILFTSCTSLDKEYNTHLRNGLETYPYARDVNLMFLPGFSLKKMAFIKKSKGEKMLVLKLNKKVKLTDVEKYSLAIKSYLNKQEYEDILKGKEYISTPIKPKLLVVNGNNYIVTPYKLKVKRIDTLEFFLFDRDKFRKVLSKPIYVKNIGI